MVVCDQMQGENLQHFTELFNVSTIVGKGTQQKIRPQKTRHTIIGGQLLCINENEDPFPIQ